MNKRGKFSRLIFVLIIAIILVVSITLSNKSEKYLIINDENLKAKVDIFLKNFFMFENFDREISNSIDTSNVGMFFTMTDEKLLYIYEKRFLVNLRENSEKKNINYDIEIKEIQIKNEAKAAKVEAEKRVDLARELADKAEEEAVRAANAEKEAKESLRLAQNARKEAEKKALEAVKESERIDEEMKLRLSQLKK